MILFHSIMNMCNVRVYVQFLWFMVGSGLSFHVNLKLISKNVRPREEFELTVTLITILLREMPRNLSSPLLLGTHHNICNKIWLIIFIMNENVFCVFLKNIVISMYFFISPIKQMSPNYFVHRKPWIMPYATHVIRVILGLISNCVWIFTRPWPI